MFFELDNIVAFSNGLPEEIVSEILFRKLNSLRDVHDLAIARIRSFQHAHNSFSSVW